MNENKEEVKLRKLAVGDTANDVPFFAALSLFGLGGAAAGLMSVQPSADQTYLESLVTNPTIPISEHDGYTPIAPVIAGSLFFAVSVRRILQILRK